jgi:hypothetical protein
MVAQNLTLENPDEEGIKKRGQRWTYWPLLCYWTVRVTEVE